MRLLINILVLLTSVGTLSIASGCSRKEPTWRGPGAEWVIKPPAELDAADFEAMQDDKIFNVLPDRRDEAITELDSRPVVPLTQEEFVRYTGGPAVLEPGQSWFLVRGITFEGRIDLRTDCILRYTDSLVVRNPRGINYPLLKRPLVVPLQRPAVRVYFTFFSAV